MRSSPTLALLLGALGASACADDLAPDAVVAVADPVDDVDPATAAVPAGGPRAPDEGGALRTLSPALARAQATALAHLAARGVGAGDLAVRRLFTDELGTTHVHVQGRVGGVPVLGSEAIVHVGEDGAIADVTDDLARDVRVDPRPTLTAAAAVDAAVAAHGCASCLTARPRAELVVHRDAAGAHLAYRVQLEQLGDDAPAARPLLVVDAHDGRVLLQHDNLHRQAATGTATSTFNGTLTGFRTYVSAPNGTYSLENHVDRAMTVYGGPLFGFNLDSNNLWGQPGESPIVKQAIDAHHAAGKFFAYFRATHARNGLDGAGGPGYWYSINGTTRLDGPVAYCLAEINNAYWSGHYPCLGRGDGFNSLPWVSLDITGHELMHGVVQHTAHLTYLDQSGALDESYADVFGSLVERYARNNVENDGTWKLGEDFLSPFMAGDALRYLATPHLGNQPDHLSEYVSLPPSNDSGGVHTNSGIGNKAFHLLARGGTHHLTGAMVPAGGIGADAAARIWYLALRAYMTSSTNFAGARVATLSAAAALYGAGSANHTAVARAWTMVGVS